MDRSRGLVFAAAAPTTLLTVLTLAACNPFVTPYRPDPAVELHREGATMASQWNGALAAPDGRAAAAALTGTATATPALDGVGTYVYVSLAGAAPGAAYAWQLRQGACGGAGALVATAGALGALAANDEGRAAGSGTVPLRLSPGAHYHVRVGGTAADSGTVIACGDLTPPTR
jgi:hypothetical protein